MASEVEAWCLAAMEAPTISEGVQGLFQRVMAAEPGVLLGGLFKRESDVLALAPAGTSDEVLARLLPEGWRELPLQRLYGEEVSLPTSFATHALHQNGSCCALLLFASASDTGQPTIESLCRYLPFVLLHFDRLAHETSRDHLTGLYSKRYFMDRLEGLFEFSTRHLIPMAVGMIDLDGFKRINEQQGHVAGDRILRQVGQRLLGSLRASDVVARLGGDEFGLILLHVKPAELNSVARRICTNIAGAAFDADRTSVDITISMGLAEFNPTIQGQAPADLFHIADTAQRQAKAQGGNRASVVFPPE